MKNQFQNKHVAIEAVQWHGHGDHPAVRPLADSDDMHLIGMGGATLKLPACRAVYGVIGTPENPLHLVMPGDWIIKNGADSYSPLAPDVFDVAYEPCQADAGGDHATGSTRQANFVQVTTNPYFISPDLGDRRFWVVDASALVGSSDNRATWSTRQWVEHVGAWENNDGQVCFGSWMAVHAMLLQFQAMTVRELTAGVTKAALDVLAERRRQVEKEGFWLEQDDAQENGELAKAAICYANPVAHCQLGIPHQWPWVAEWWKPRDRRHNLVRAGSLIIAEIERLDRPAVVKE